MADMLPIDLATSLGHALLARGWRITCAESCTGGLVAAHITAVAGSSQWFDQGFITYSNEAKMRELAVSADVLQAHGAVSGPVVLAMAQGAMQRSGAQLAIAVSGIAGPGGGSAEKPVGTVWLAWVMRGAGGVRTDLIMHTEPHLFKGDRQAVRQQATQRALTQALQLLQ